MTRRRLATAIALLCGVGLTACAGLDARGELAAGVAAGAGLIRADTPGGPFTLATWSRITDPSTPLTVYIEGDGLAWTTSNQISPDPTPTDPLGLRLAALDTAANVLYIARPCQFQPPAGTTGCDPDYWTSRIYSAEVIASIDAVIDAFAARTRGGVHLVGYSGGGAVAVLAAAARSDVLDLRTIAGNISTARFTAYHKVSPYRASLDPADVASRLNGLPQIHFVGARDKVAPALIAEDYAARMGPSPCLAIVTVPVSHERGWTEAWPEAMKRRPGCSS
jgi:pimeloyl-ACP methyl ester carboxylesterase